MRPNYWLIKDMIDKMNSQQKGVLGELNLVEIFDQLLSRFGSITSLRRYESGYQGGKDVKGKAIIKKNNCLGQVGKQKICWFFEVKNYKTQLENKLLIKAHQLLDSGLKVDCLCFFSPLQDVAGYFEDSLTNEKILSLPKFPFNIVLWTPAFRIKEKLKVFPEIYEQIYGERPNLKAEEIKAILDDWIAEISEQTKKGTEIRKSYIKAFKGNEPIWVPESEDEAKKVISIYSSMEEQKKIESVLKDKLNTGGINSHQEVLKAKRLRILSEGCRRRYKKKNEYMYSRLNALRIQLESFALDIEKQVFSKEETCEASHFIRKFQLEIVQFKKDFRDQEIIERLPDFYYEGQIYDITGECILSLSKKWLEKTKEIVQDGKY